MSHRTRARRLAVLGTAVAATAFAVPATANAAVGSAIDAGTKTVTMTGDDAADILTITEAAGLWNHNQTGNGYNSALDFDNVTAGDQTIAADATWTLVVNAGGGDDNITIVTPNVLGSTLAGDAGNDLLTGSSVPGSAVVDNVRGGAGNDRLVPGRGNDDMEGGDGNDVLVWNNGDGTDVMDGDAGNDEVEVNGDPTRGDDFAINANGGRVKFDRLNLGLFSLDIGSSERVVVNGLGGDDRMTGGDGLAPLTLLTLNGGAGVDTITGGDGADLIQGGEDNDNLAGGPGGDRIIGDRGADAMIGGAGDDTLVWNNGDGSDTMDGEDGLDVIEVNGGGTADTFTIAPNGARVKFDRTNPGPFTLNIGTSEALDLNGLAGDDAFTVGAGAAALIAINADGGAGNDALAGAEGDDTFAGGSGNDVLTGGGGRDLLDGQAGDDRLEMRDGAEDLGRGGAGTDSAVADQAGIDALAEIESIDRTPVAPPVVPPVVPGPGPDAKGTAALVRASSATVRKSGNRFSVRLPVLCPDTEAGGCTGTVTLTGNVRIGGRRINAVLGSAKFNLTKGQRRTITVKLPSRLNGLVSGRTLSARAQTVSSDKAGNLASASRKVTLRLPRR